MPGHAVPVRPNGGAFPGPEPRPPDNFDTSYRPSPGGLKPGVGSHRAKVSFSLKQQSVFHNRQRDILLSPEPVDLSGLTQKIPEISVWIS
jgi:hypothetical protein